MLVSLNMDVLFRCCYSSHTDGRDYFLPVTISLTRNREELLVIIIIRHLLPEA